MSLPVAAGKPYALLSDHAGKPVWPVSCARDRQHLGTVADLFGATLSDVRAEKAAGGCLHYRSPGHVVGLGDVMAETRLYAHLTGRSYEVLDSSEEIERHGAPDVILLARPRLDADLIEALFSRAAHLPVPGVVWGRNKQELRLQVLRCTAGCTMDGPVKSRHVDVIGWNTQASGQAAHRIVHGDTAPAEVRKALSEGTGLLTIHAHGEASTIVLGSTLVICAVDQPPADADRRLAPACLHTGYCPRVSKPLRAAVEAEDVVAPELIAARVLVLESCKAISVCSGAMDSAWGLFARLVANPRIGAVIASPENRVEVGSGLSEDLCDELAAGVPAGKALTRCNASPTVAESGGNLLLFGDPRVKAAPQDTNTLIAHSTASRQLTQRTASEAVQPPASRAEAEFEALRLVACCVTGGMGHGVTSDAARAALTDYEHDFRLNGDRAASGELMRRALLQHLQTLKGHVYLAWRRTHLVRQPELVRCPQCQWRVYPLRASFASGCGRVLVNCPRCGFVVDEPEPPVLKMKVNVPCVELSGVLPQNDWSAAVFLSAKLGHETVMQPWPSNVDGTPVWRLEVPIDCWPPGPVTVQLVMIAARELRSVAAIAQAVRETREASVQ